jgi:photosystem II stability/assembly factor-like uncharacterized protein
MSDDERDRDLDALLRQPAERLAPLDGSFALVSRRARRRKFAKAAVGVAAGVIVLAGAVPAVIAVRHNSNDQSLAINDKTIPASHSRSGPSQSPSVQPRTPLTGFFPQSLSFVTPTEGYLWGSIGTSRRGVLARTVDGGTNWAKVGAPPVNFSSDGGNGDGQVRFAYSKDGFVFGSSYFATRDGGSNWQRVPSPGYIDDLETSHGQVWALVRPCETCQNVRLYSATVSNPSLTRVRRVPKMRSLAGADSIALNYTTAGAVSVDVLVGSSAFYTSVDGRHWKRSNDPCPTEVHGGTVQTALLSTLNLGEIVAACGYNISAGTEDKRVMTTTSSGMHWQRTATNPSVGGYLETLSAGTGSSMMIGSSRYGAQVTHDGGQTWKTDDASGTELSFVGFISLTHVVALADRSDEEQGAFATSNDSGRDWSVTPFPM